MAPPAGAAAAPRAYGWGYGLAGRATQWAYTPVRTGALDGVKSIGCGDYACYAIRSDGRVVSWGWGYGGLLGDGRSRQNVTRSTPALVPTVTHAVQVAGTEAGGFALDRDGRVWSWGTEALGRRAAAPAKPGRVGGLPRIAQLATVRAGGDMEDTVLALASSGKVFGWGANAFGELLDHHAGMAVKLPIRVGLLSGIVSLGAQAGYGCFAVKRDGSVLGWGWFEHPNRRPVAVHGLTHIVKVSASDGGVAMLRNDGTVWVPRTGWAVQGQPGAEQQPGLSGTYTDIATSGYDHADQGSAGTIYALRKNGTVWSWGQAGGFGNGSKSDYVNHPVRVSGLTQVKRIYGGSATSGYAFVG